MPTLSANLFIASEPHQLRDLQWRVKLVDNQKLYPAKELTALIARVSKGSTNPPTQKERQEVSRLAISEKFEIDEFHLAILVTVALLKNPNGISNKLAIQTDGILNFEFKKYNGSVDQFAALPKFQKLIETKKEILRHHADILAEHDLPRIRALLAFKEIAALFDPDTLIPHLVGITPKYLASPLTQKWILKQQYNSKHGKFKNVVNVSDKNLKLLTKAITGDKRQHKKRVRPHWATGFIYDDLVSYIEGFRRRQREGDLDLQFFDIYCKQREIPKDLIPLMLERNPTPSELAIEIMIRKDVIESEKTFRAIQTKLSKVQKRHFDGNILSIASDIHPVVFHFIDVPSTIPEIVSRIDIFKYLETVEIPEK